MTDLIEATPQPPNRSLPRAALPWICTLLLLCGIAADRLRVGRKSVDAQAYHLRIKKLAANVPYHFGNWLGVDVPVPIGAVKLLKPNVILSRRFEEMQTGRQVTLLVVQCRDARDILGHYPPVCYPANGWTLDSAGPHDWTVDDLAITGTTYAFNTGQHPFEKVTVDNFMLLPSGQTARDMDAVELAAQDLQRKFFGAAQVQLVYPPNTPESERAELFPVMIRMLRPLIDATLQKGMPSVEKHP
jgi:hypothetical protein